MSFDFLKIVMQSFIHQQLRMLSPRDLLLLLKGLVLQFYFFQLIGNIKLLMSHPLHFLQTAGVFNLR